MTSQNTLPTSPTSLNVIALISGGKDSLYSILHCIRNGHKVVALGNLYPKRTTTNTTNNDSNATETSRDDKGDEEEEEEEEDIDSFMYQTIGHSIIPQYESALGIPLYRQEIVGSAVDTGRVYRDTSSSSSSSSSPKGDGNEEGTEEKDETESLIPLLTRIKRAHPEANAISAGAILSTYQRTRIENVAARMGLAPLAWLWMYPVLPAPVERLGLPGEAGLLEDMAAVGCEARIIKVASGGLDGGFLWGDVAGRDGM
ncbi:diphthine--ammonia ligase family protein, partial [Aspergillus ibericus CBS 121593]